MQIAYAETEGYVPVTGEAQASPEYQDYLSRGGEDNDQHYAVKIKASRLLLEHTQDTFVTPVFNGSASLRDAAGQLIENVTKAVRRKQTVDDDAINALYQDITALYRLDQKNPQGGGAAAAKQDLGPLPGTAVALLSALGGAWALILLYLALRALRQRKR